MSDAVTDHAPLGDIRVSVDGHVGIAEICRAPNNYFDIALIGALAAAFERFDADPEVRAILLCAAAKAPISAMSK